MKKKERNIIFKYAVASLGLLLVALGVALSVVSNLGTSPLSAPPYVMSGTWNLSVGNWTIIVNMTYLVIQLAIFRKNFKMKYLTQILATVVFGYMIDFCIWCLGSLNATTFISRIVLSVLACAVTALGVSIEVVARAWMLSAEMTVYAVSKTWKLPFGKVKIAMDCTLVVISMILSYIMYDNPFGRQPFETLSGVFLGHTQGIVIGTGTVLMAILAGGLMRWTDPIADKFIDALIRHLLVNLKK